MLRCLSCVQLCNSIDSIGFSHKLIKKKKKFSSSRFKNYIYTPNNRVPKYLKQKWTDLKGDLVLQQELESLVYIFNNGGLEQH